MFTSWGSAAFTPTDEIDNDTTTIEDIARWYDGVADRTEQIPVRAKPPSR